MKWDHKHLESAYVDKLWQYTHPYFKRKPKEQWNIPNSCHQTEAKAHGPLKNGNWAAFTSMKTNKLHSILVNGHLTMQHFAKTKDNVLGSKYKGIKRVSKLDRSRYHGECAIGICEGIHVINLIVIMYMSICPDLHVYVIL